MSLDKCESGNILIRTAAIDDVNEIRQLVLRHGNAQWHYFSSGALEKHLKGIASGAEQAVIALEMGILPMYAERSRLACALMHTLIYF